MNTSQKRLINVPQRLTCKGSRQYENLFNIDQNLSNQLTKTQNHLRNKNAQKYPLKTKTHRWVYCTQSIWIKFKKLVSKSVISPWVF